MAHLCVSDKSCPQLILCLYPSGRRGKVFSESSYMEPAVTTPAPLYNLRICLGTGDINARQLLP